MHPRQLRRVTGESGAVAIIVALLAVTLFGFAALVVDIGNADSVHEQGQNAVDAAALAGVRTLASGGSASAVVVAVQSYVEQNIGATDWHGCTDNPAPLIPADTDLTDSCISTLTSGTPGVTSYQVRVRLPAKHVPSTFGGLFGVSSIAISPVAQALSGQPLPPECGPCDPVLDESTGQPKPQTPTPVLPAQVRSELPDPNDPTLPLGTVDAVGCPSPGVFDATTVTIPVNFTCTIKPGLYVFNDSTLDVQGVLKSFLSAGDPVVPDNTGVTFVFYGTDPSPLTVEGTLGPILASHLDVSWQAGQPIPGVAIVIDQFTPGGVAPRTFTLGNDFDITGSVYALDGQTTWKTAMGDCPAVVPPVCALEDDIPGGTSVLATTDTDFFRETPLRIPTVGTDHPMVEPPPSAPHLVK